ncbi:hypothetical protein GOV03_00815, partial [Candidatus Woesearchaeota archaeon]|nr:hypothetical protein [Candidatus Woesearchaeota archaeon]
GEVSTRIDQLLPTTPQDRIQRTLDSIIGDYIQRTEREKLIHDRSTVEREIKESILESNVSEKYGIKINDFRLNESDYIKEETEANVKRQAAVAHAEGEYAAAQIKKKSIKTLAEADAEKYKILENAMNPQTPAERADVRQRFDNLVKYRTLRERSGDVVWMLDGETPVPTYRPK